MILLDCLRKYLIDGVKFNKYRRDRFLELTKIIRNEREEEQRRVKDKAHEMVDQYDR